MSNNTLLIGNIVLYIVQVYMQLKDKIKAKKENENVSKKSKNCLQELIIFKNKTFKYIINNFKWVREHVNT